MPFVFAGVVLREDKMGAALEQIARHTFQRKASIMRRYAQEGVAKEVRTSL